MVLVTMTMMMMMMMARHGSQLQPNATELEEQDERSGRRLLGHDSLMHIIWQSVWKVRLFFSKVSVI